MFERTSRRSGSPTGCASRRRLLRRPAARGRRAGDGPHPPRLGPRRRSGCCSARPTTRCPTGGALIVYEAMIDDDRRENAFGLLMSLNMLIETPGGFDYTGADCRGWMRGGRLPRELRRAPGRARLDGRRDQVSDEPKSWAPWDLNPNLTPKRVPLDPIELGARGISELAVPPRARPTVPLAPDSHDVRAESSHPLRWSRAAGRLTHPLGGARSVPLARRGCGESATGMASGVRLRFGGRGTRRWQLRRRPRRARSPSADRPPGQELKARFLATWSNSSTTRSAHRNRRTMRRDTGR